MENNNKKKPSKLRKPRKTKRRYSKLTIYLRDRVYIITGFLLLLIIIGVFDRGRLSKVINNQWKTIDKGKNEEKLMRHMLRQVKSGKVLTIPCERLETSSALLRLINNIFDMGYSFLPLQEYLVKKYGRKWEKLDV